MRLSRLAAFERRLTRERAYWLQALAGEPIAAALPLDSSRPPRYEAAKRAVAIPLAADAAARAARTARQEPALAFALVVAALDVCLFRTTLRDDLVVCAAVPDTLEAAAAVNDLVPLRLRVTDERTVSEWLALARTTLAEAFRHAKYPFDRLLDLVAIPRPANRTPLAAIGVAFDGFNDRRRLDRAMTDLVVSGRLRGGRLEAEIAYDSRIFAPSSIEVFAGHLARATAWMVDHPGARIGELTLLSDDDRRRALVEFNATDAPYPSDQTMHQLVEAQADRTPDRVAARSADSVLTYAQLDRRANQLAHVLAAKGAGPGQRVGILLAHSPETIVSVLGVLKSGAAYVPLDPEHPAGRIGLMLDDAGVQIVVTTEALAHLAGDRDVIRLDADGARLVAAPSERPAGRAAPGDSAYVIYTSGSTGTPKGVAIAHRSLVNYVWWARSVYLNGEATDAALHSSLAFDLTVTSIFAPLVTGGAVVSYQGRDGEPAILDVLADDKVGLIKLTPSHLALVADERSLPSRLRALIVGGENLDTALARRVHERFGGRVAIFNEYGPTEATVGCMIHRFDPDRDHRAAVPIGVPAANTCIYVLDGRLEPAAPGGVGQIYIGGDGLALGYLGQPELTADRFVADPFRPGARMYRTGDVARRLPDGPIEFLGRNDDQVKIRGHRIDLNEVRHAVVQHPGVRDAAVRRLDDADGSGVIVAYCVSRQPIDAAELRAFARERLVDAAVPAAFVFLRRLPLTLNGKMNHRALPGLDDIRRQAVRSSEPPRTPTEQAVAAIWRQLLNLDRVGVHDNFFELGGHSLIATQVVSRVRDALGVELPLRSLFEQPTIAGLAARIDGTGVDSATPDAIARVPRDGALPLSFAQQRLWFLDQLEPGSPVYNIAAKLGIDGPLDPAALGASFDALVARHESLRTTFDDEDGRPRQRIAERLALDLPVVDLSTLDPDDQAVAVDRTAAEEAAAPFDLRRGPLVRARLLRLAPERHVLLFTLHHIIADGWSMGVLARELSAVYAARIAGRAADLAPLPVQYADFAVWQRGVLTGDPLSREIAFWRSTLDGVPVIELPTDRPRPPVQTFRGASLPVELSPGLASRVREMARAFDATPFMAMLAAYAALLHRWTGQADFAIGSPVANRTRPDIEGLIGFFANTIVLRAKLDGRPTFRELVARVKAASLDAFAHQDLPFERLVEELQPERALSHNPIFQVMFGLHPAAAPSLALPGLAFSRLDVETGTAKFDLNLLLDEDGDRIAGVLEYNTDLFDESTIVRLRSHLETLLTAALDRPDARVDDLPVMPEGERRLVLDDWNATREAYPDACVHELVEAAVERTPEATAVVFPGAPDQTLTYRELNERANRLAHYLRALGVGPDVPVAICLERSLDMAVAVLAVLKAGGAYVPLDPTYPRERLLQMLEDTSAPVVVSHAATRDRLPPIALARLVWLDADRHRIAGQPDTNPESGVAPDNLLYVIYTSGSTGRPKGIALSHRALVNLVWWNLVTLAEGRGMLQFAPLGFDASFHEMFAAWASGRYLAMIPEHWRRDPSELISYLERWPVETAILPVVVLHQWAEARQGDSRALGALRHLVTTGEQLVVTQPIVELFARLPACRLHNHYGPSESHVVTALTLDRDPATWPARPSIGRPIANCGIYILDSRLNPAPIGVAGELYIAGANLARGYLNRPDLTAAKFVPHPFSFEPGERLYATGDLARWRADGAIEFLGRRDDQVKIRGFRVEIGDVESTLNRHPDVSQTVVTVHAGPAGQRLIAYVVGAAGRVLTVDTLRRFAEDELPDYMVPAAFVVLDAVTLTANGKIDRRALPAPPADRPELAGAFVEPNGAAEALMADIWKDLLGVARVGASDNFFHLGGHSLVATQLVSRIRRTFETPLPLRAVFEAPTVTGLVDALARAAGGRDVVDEIAWAVREVDRMSPEQVRTALAESPGDRP